jgi:hypothetical protein
MVRKWHIEEVRQKKKKNFVTEKSENREDLHCRVVEKNGMKLVMGLFCLYMNCVMRAGCWVSETLTERKKLRK